MGPNNEGLVCGPVSYDACQVESRTLAQEHLWRPRYLRLRIYAQESTFEFDVIGAVFKIELKIYYLYHFTESCKIFQI